MKILTREEETEHYKHVLLVLSEPSTLTNNTHSETLKGGFLGGGVGLTLGAGGIYLATLRYPAFRQLTLPLRAFLVTSSTTFGAIVTADHFSRSYEASRHPDEGFKDESERARAEDYAQKSTYDKAMAWGKENRYPIVAGSWVASMAISLGLVGRNPYLSTSQKLVQARVYAQTLTIAVLIASAAFEIGDQNAGEGRWETIKVLDPNDPTHKHLIEKKVHHERYPGEDQWKDMVEVEEQKIQQRKDAVHEQELKDEKASKTKHKEHEKKHTSKKDGKDDEKSDSKKDNGNNKKSDDKKDTGNNKKDSGDKKDK